jgi:hypothetical protein
LSVIQTWKGGSSHLYLPTLRERCPGCTIRPLPSSSTEGAFLVPLRDGWVGGVPVLLSTVLELLPVERAGAPEDFVDLAELEPGRGYRLAITNQRGLYRYLIDDVFFVDGDHAGLPILRYSHRHGLTSSLTGEKLTEVDVTNGMGAALAGSDLKVAEFQLGPRWGEPPCYLLVVELEQAPETPRLRALLHDFEAALCACNLEYRAKRESGRLGRPELWLVPAGEFERLRRAQSSELGRSDAQTKLPRLRTQLIEPGSFASIRKVAWADDG